MLRGTLRNCNTSGVLAQGLACQGPGSLAQLTEVSVVDCTGVCVTISDAARATMTACEIRNSLHMQGIIVQGAGALLRMVTCIVCGSHEAAVAAVLGGRIELHACDVSRSATMQGIVSQDVGSVIVADQCRIHNSYVSSCTGYAEVTLYSSRV